MAVRTNASGSTPAADVHDPDHGQEYDHDPHQTGAENGGPAGPRTNSHQLITSQSPDPGGCSWHVARAPKPAECPLAPAGPGEQLVRRTNAIYNGALRIYNDMVERWLPAFNQRHQMSHMLPMRLEGELRLSGTPTRRERNDATSYGGPNS